ncbi:MAG: hypothetical protein JWN41_1440 [Thermoleophilia bacterium]|nr:hypothetical protein [Thermoleophilia bacterium]
MIRCRFSIALLALTMAGLVLAACGKEGGGDARDRAGSKATRPSSSTPAQPSKATPDSSATPKVALRRVGRFDRPVLAIEVPGTDLVAVVEQSGRILTASHMTCARPSACPAEPVHTGSTVLDLRGTLATGNEQGLLGLAFHPDWPTDPRIFVDFTDRKGTTHIEAWTWAGTAKRAQKQQTLIEIVQPYANHNGGNLRFGPDDLLYIGMGDGGDAGDPGDRAQTAGELLGKLLRIDVDRGGGRGYAIPKGNLPGGSPEVWALGLRNPWRFSFDAKTGDLWIGDVGQNKYEEIDVIPTAKVVQNASNPNFGWRRTEGFSDYDSSGATGPGTMTQPVLDYSHDHGCSISGGVVYRGSQLPRLDGWYLFADFCSDELRLLNADGVPGVEQRRGSLTYHAVKGAAQINSFSEVQHGEVLATATDGNVYQVVAG